MSRDLILSPEKKEEIVQDRQIAIKIDEKSERDISREIVSAYISNFRTIKLHGKELENKAEKIIEMVHGLIALEIIDQTTEAIVTRDFLNMNHISLDQLIKRMDILTRSMIADSKNSIKNDFCSSLIRRDKDVNRLAILVLRTIKYRLGLSGEEHNSLFLYHVIYDQLEKIADDAKRISKYLVNNEFKKDEITKIEEIYDLIEKVFADVMKAYYLKDIVLAHRTSKTIRENILKKCAALENITKNKNCATLAEKFKTMCNHIKTVNRINY